MSSTCVSLLMRLENAASLVQMPHTALSLVKGRKLKLRAKSDRSSS
jgi:hypothetical protein